VSSYIRMISVFQFSFRNHVNEAVITVADPWLALRDE